MSLLVFFVVWLGPIALATLGMFSPSVGSGGFVFAIGWAFVGFFTALGVAFAV